MTPPFPVLIVGAGPAGLALACELRRHDVACRIIDQNGAPSSHSKALAVHARTLELLEQHDGLVGEFLAGGRKVYGTNVYADGERIVHVDFDELDSPHPYILILPQAETERRLEARALSLGVTVERNCKLVAIAQDDGGVTATVERDSVTETLRARWLVGCDGAHSTVRHASPCTFDGAATDEAFVLADVRVDWDMPEDEAHVFLNERGVLAAFPLPGEDRWRLLASHHDGETTLADWTTLMQLRTDKPCTLSKLEWSSSFRIHRRLASAYRDRRVFLAGDSAHVHSPVGGQGMNTGIQDAVNLAWKLALVDRSEGHAVLLDSYAIERRPIAALTVQGTDLATRVVTLRNPVARELRNMLAEYLSSVEAVQARMVASAAETAVHYRESPIVEENRTSVARSHFKRDPNSERPSIADWVEFSNGPAPGERVPDAKLADGRRLFDVLRGPSHHLFLFDGAAATDEGYRNFLQIARRVSTRCGARVALQIVVPTATLPPLLRNHPTSILDSDQVLHRRFGAGSECMYLVRPDGYVGFRSQPANGDVLMDYLARIFV